MTGLASCSTDCQGGDMRVGLQETDRTIKGGFNPVPLYCSRYLTKGRHVAQTGPGAQWSYYQLTTL